MSELSDGTGRRRHTRRTGACCLSRTSFLFTSRRGCSFEALSISHLFWQTELKLLVSQDGLALPHLGWIFHCFSPSASLHGFPIRWGKSLGGADSSCRNSVDNTVSRPDVL